jgi:hypothetical protein
MGRCMCAVHGVLLEVQNSKQENVCVCVLCVPRLICRASQHHLVNVMSKDLTSLAMSIVKTQMMTVDHIYTSKS